MGRALSHKHSEIATYNFVWIWPSNAVVPKGPAFGFLNYLVDHLGGFAVGKQMRGIALFPLVP